MTIRITVEIEEEDINDISGTLEHISEMIEQGYTSGYYPTWEIS